MAEVKTFQDVIDGELKHAEVEELTSEVMAKIGTAVRDRLGVESLDNGLGNMDENNVRILVCQGIGQVLGWEAVRVHWGHEDDGHGSEGHHSDSDEHGRHGEDDGHGSDEYELNRQRTMCLSYWELPGCYYNK